MLVLKFEENGVDVVDDMVLVRLNLYMLDSSRYWGNEKMYRQDEKCSTKKIICSLHQRILYRQRIMA